MKLIQKTVYFRPDCVPLWNVIKNKAEWLHLHLHDKQLKQPVRPLNSPGVPPKGPESITPPEVLYIENYEQPREDEAAW